MSGRHLRSILMEQLFDFWYFFCNDTATTEIYTLSLHDALPIFIALGAGLISFLSPCVLPLIPGYISFISGQSLNELVESKKINFVPLFLFSLGFSFVFIIFGATASVLGKFLLQNSNQLRIAAGLIIIIFSLQLLGIVNIKFLNYEKKYGKKTIVLMEVGSFFEFYGVSNNKEQIGDAKKVCELLNIQLTRRNKSILEKK